MDIDAFVAYADRYESGYGSKVVGATPAEIDTFEALVGRPLPLSYRSFLRRLGKHDGGLTQRSDASMKIEDLVEYYRDVIADGDTDTFPTDCIVIAYLGVAVFERSLDLASGPEPRVIFTSGPEKKGALAESLEKLLYRTAFWRFRMARQAHRLCLVPRAGCSLETLSNAAEAFGVSRERFSDDVYFCGSSGATLLQIGAILWYPQSIELASNDKQSLDSVATSLQGRLELEQRWRLGG